MSQILSLFGYDTFDLEVNIYAMAEDVHEISDLMKDAESLKKLILNPWEVIMQIWAAFLSIAILIFLISLIINGKSEWRNRTKRQDDKQLLAEPLPEDAVEGQKPDRKSEEDARTLHPDNDTAPVELRS